MRRKPLEQRRPNQSTAGYYEDPEREAIELREAAAAGVPFLNIQEALYTEPVNRTSGNPWEERATQASREWGALKEEGVGRTDTADTGVGTNDEESGLGVNWKPRYLTRRIVASFAAVFVVLVIIVEALAGVDRESSGLGYPNGGVSVLWTYGPPASKLGGVVRTSKGFPRVFFFPFSANRRLPSPYGHSSALEPSRIPNPTIPPLDPPRRREERTPRRIRNLAPRLQ